VWKGAAAAREARDWEIRMLVESAGAQNIAKAIARVDAFRKEYPAQAQGLIRQVVERIQERIQSLREDPAAEAKEELNRLSKAYMEFSKELYERAVPADPNEAYVARQMYADALWVAGSGEESLKFWQQCAAEDADRAGGLAKAVDEETERNIKRVQDARRDKREADLEQAVQDYLKALGDANAPIAGVVTEALKAMKGAVEADERDRRMGSLADKTIGGYKALAIARKKQFQGGDVLTILGMARAHSLLKQYPEAMDNYKKLRMISRQSYGVFYWEIQLELCRTAMEGFRSDKKQMLNLAQWIQQLRMEDPRMGGKLGLFNQIESDAKKAAL
jgi:tetratricopeptide (TPR) repeat protein